MRRNQFGNRDHDKNWLQKVSEQSWEPELLISGLAIYATIQIPGMLKSLLWYYQYNIQSGTGFIDELPVMALSMFITAIIVVKYGFIFHFAVRAFWVGLVGLKSVFREGIKYKELKYSLRYRQQMKKNLGSSDAFLMANDRLASMIFSITFLIVLYLLAIGTMYFVFFILFNGMKLFLAPETYDVYSQVLFYTFGGVFVLIGLLNSVLSMERFRENERAATMHLRLNTVMNRIALPFITKPIQYLMLTFMSNLKTSTYYTYFSVLMTSFFTIFFFTMLEVQGVSLFQPRDFYAERSPLGRVDSWFYESENNEEFVLNPTIQRPELSANEYITLFIPYSKLLDVKLDQTCDIPEPDKEMNRYEKRRYWNEKRLDCVNDFFQLSIDEIALPSDLLFTTHPRTEQAGFRSFLDIPDSLEAGMYTLNVHRPLLDEADAERDSLGRLLTFEAEIPFWLEDER